MVDDDNERASGFWSAVGFTTDESTDSRWTSAGLTIYMRCALTGAAGPRPCSPTSPRPQFDLLTWRKGPAPDIPADEFTTITCADDRGREHDYDLADTTITLTIRDGPRKGQTVPLRQVTRRVPARGGGTRQIHALTSRTDLAAGEVCWRLTSRWREENYFRYARTHFALDALDSHAATPDDPDRKVPNPARKAAAAQVRHAEILAAAAQAQRDASLAALRNPAPGQPVTITNQMINALDAPVETAAPRAPRRPGRRGSRPRPHPPRRDQPGHGSPGSRGQADHPRHPDGRLQRRNHPRPRPERPLRPR